MLIERNRQKMQKLWNTVSVWFTKVVPCAVLAERVIKKLQQLWLNLQQGQKQPIEPNKRDVTIFAQRNSRQINYEMFEAARQTFVLRRNNQPYNGLQWLVDNINRHFNIHKLPDRHVPALFIDWAPAGAELPNEDVEADPGYFYPGQPFTDSRNAAPELNEDLRQYYWVNKYKLPVVSQNVSFVLRLCVAPFTSIKTNHYQILEHMGFAQNDYWTRSHQIINNTEEWVIFEARNAPTATFLLERDWRLIAKTNKPSK